MNIIDHLTTPGRFVLTPKGELACVRSFNATTNEVEVTTGATGFVEALSKSMNSFDQLAAEMRAAGHWRLYHFSKLRVAKDPNDA